MGQTHKVASGEPDARIGHGQRDACAIRHIGSLASRRSGLPVQSRGDLRELLVLMHGDGVAVPYGSDGLRGLPAVLARAGDDRIQRHTSQLGGKRPHLRTALSSSGIPGVVPVSTWPVPAVRPCRTRRTNVTPLALRRVMWVDPGASR
jgi:hypothetical protein